VRLAMVHVESAAFGVQLVVKDGGGNTAAIFDSTATTYATFADAVSITNPALGQIPPDLIIEETDVVQLVAVGGVFATTAVVSYEEYEE